MEERLREKIHPDLKSQVSLESEKDLFLSTIASAILAILRELELTIDVPFAQMLKSPWRDAEFVSSESSYVSELTRAILVVIGVVREGVELKKYIRSACDKIVG